MAETKKKYIQAIGRRKEASAQIRLFSSGSGSVIVNNRDYKKFFPVVTLQHKVVAPFIATGNEGKFDVTVKVIGGGMVGQADSVRLGIARALLLFNPDYRAALKKLGYLKRDARVRERKKYGKKSARRSPQWAKR